MPVIANYRHVVRDKLRSVRTKLGLRILPVSARPDKVKYGDIALHDSKRSGWFNSETGELFAGFPIKDADTVIDVGCGTGIYLEFCVKYAHAKHVIGIDIDPSRIQATNQRLIAAGAHSFNTHTSDGYPLPIENESADKVICMEVLEHVEDPARTMCELARVGKPGALFLLSVPDALCEHVQEDLAPASHFQHPNHIRIFERTDFERLVEDAGLIIEKRAFLSFFWAVWHAIVWKCNIDFDGGRHPALDHWAMSWREVLSLPDGQKVKDALDKAMPKSQLIIARKPLHE